MDEDTSNSVYQRVTAQLKSNMKLYEIHAKRKIERDRIDKEQNELIAKFAKTNANAA